MKSTVILLVSIFNFLALIWVGILGLVETSLTFWIFFLISLLFFMIAFGESSKKDKDQINLVMKKDENDENDENEENQN